MTHVKTSCSATAPEHDIRLEGDIDLASQPELEAAVTMFVECAHRDVCVDAASLDFIDSTGLTFLVHVARLSRQRGGGVRVTGAPRQLARMVEVTALPIEMDPDPDSSCGAPVGGRA